MWAGGPAGNANRMQRFCLASARDAAAPARDRHWWTGPVEVSVDDLVRLAGPETDVLVPIGTDEWEDDGRQMQGGRLLLEDGNHRYEALVRADAETAWVLVFSPTPLNAILPGDARLSRRTAGNPH